MSYNFIPTDLQAIENELGIELVAATVYGSHARGYHTAASDFDLALIFRHTAKTVLPLVTTINKHITIGDRKYDINAHELRSFAAAVADGNQHAVIQLFGNPVHNQHLIMDMRAALLRCGRAMAVHKMVMGTRGTFLTARKESEIAKAHITSLWMFVQALTRSCRKYDFSPVPLLHFTYYLNDCTLSSTNKKALDTHLTPYVLDLVAGVRKPLQQTQLTVLIDALNELASQHQYDLPVIEPQGIKYTRGDENDVTRDIADVLSRHGEL